MLIPFSFGMTATTAMIMMCGIYYGAMYGGSTTSILVNLPGESSSVVTCLDGHALARQGRAVAALGMAAFASFIAGTLGVVGSCCSPSLWRRGAAFGPPNLCADLHGAYSCTGWLARRQRRDRSSGIRDAPRHGRSRSMSRRSASLLVAPPRDGISFISVSVAFRGGRSPGKCRAQSAIVLYRKVFRTSCRPPRLARLAGGALGAAQPSGSLSECSWRRGDDCVDARTLLSDVCRATRSVRSRRYRGWRHRRARTTRDRGCVVPY